MLRGFKGCCNYVTDTAQMLVELCNGSINVFKNPRNKNEREHNNTILAALVEKCCESGGGGTECSLYSYKYSAHLGETSTLTYEGNTDILATPPLPPNTAQFEALLNAIGFPYDSVTTEVSNGRFFFDIKSTDGSNLLVLNNLIEIRSECDSQ